MWQEGSSPCALGFTLELYSLTELALSLGGQVVWFGARDRAPGVLGMDMHFMGTLQATDAASSSATLPPRSLSWAQRSCRQVLGRWAEEPAHLEEA